MGFARVRVTVKEVYEGERGREERFVRVSVER